MVGKAHWAFLYFSKKSYFVFDVIFTVNCPSFNVKFENSLFLVANVKV